MTSVDISESRYPFQEDFMEYEKLSAKIKLLFFSYVIKLLEEKNYGGVARLLHCSPTVSGVKAAALALAQRRALERQWERFEKKM